MPRQGADMTAGDGPVVSVVVPYHGEPGFLERCIESVESQTHHQVDLIVVDDCSHIRASEALAQFGQGLRIVRLDPRVGVSEARNRGALIARGDVLAFLDHDDWWPDDLVERGARDVRPGIAWCYDCEIVTTDSRRTGTSLYQRQGQWHHRSLTRENMHVYFSGAPTFKAFVHRDDFDRAGGFDSRFHGIEDFHFFVKLLANGVRIELAEQPRGFYRVHEDSATSSLASSTAGIDRWLRMLEAMPRELDLPPEAVAACARTRRYWSARQVELELVFRFRQGRIMSFASWSLLRRLIGALPELTRLEWTKLTRRVQPMSATRPR
jgi:glycosyltransferase involved in cell wall biosynthesis